MAPKERSISPTTTTRVSPIAMIATELIVRNTETARLGFAKFGLTRMKATATTTTAANNPPTRAAMLTIVRPTPDRRGLGAMVCDTSLLIGCLLEKTAGQRPGQETGYCFIVGFSFLAP